MSVIHCIGKSTSISIWLGMLVFIMLSFFQTITTGYETIISAILLTAICWIDNVKLHRLTKWCIVLLTSLLFHLLFTNINLDIKYLYEGVAIGQQTGRLYLLYGLGYIYCLFQQWILFFNHSIKQSPTRAGLVFMAGVIISFYFMWGGVVFRFLPSQSFIYYLPIIHYSAILVAQGIKKFTESPIKY